MSSSLDKYEPLREKYRFPSLLFDDDELRFLRSIREYVERYVIPKRLDIEGGWNRDKDLAIKTIDELYKRIVDLGVQKAFIPRKYGGFEQRYILELGLAEELARGDPGFSLFVDRIPWFLAPFIAADRGDFLKEFSKKLDEPWTASVAITEPQGGANVEDPTQEGRSIRTKAELKNGEYILNGHKIWPMGGPPEEFRWKYLKGILGYIVVATTDPNKGREGIGLFYVPPDAKGLEFSKPYKKMGMCYVDSNVEIWLRNVRIPKEYRIASPGEDADIFYGLISGTAKLADAARCIGAAEAVFEILLEWISQRRIMGKPVREYSLFANIVGEMAMRLEAARSFYLLTCWMVENSEVYGPPHSPTIVGRCGAARAFACDVALWIMSKAMELMGAYGYSYEMEVEKFYRDTKIIQLWLGGPQRDRLDNALSYYQFTWR